jgi:hypothetical protein
MRFWGDSAFGVGGTRKLRLRVPSPVARLLKVMITQKVGSERVSCESFDDGLH